MEEQYRPMKILGIKATYAFLNQVYTTLFTVAAAVARERPAIEARITSEMKSAETMHEVKVLSQRVAVEQLAQWRSTAIAQNIVPPQEKLVDAYHRFSAISSAVSTSSPW